MSAEKTASSMRSASMADRAIITSRLIDAPREIVFDAFTSPGQVVHWWGPAGFTNTIEVMDVRAGGEWRLVMHGPDGTNYKNRMVYVEVTRPERLVYDHVSGPTFHAVVTLQAHEEKTHLTMEMLFETAEARDKVAREFGAVEGAKQTLARLAEYVAKR